MDEPNMYRTAMGESTVSLESTVRDEAAQKLSSSSGQTRAGVTDVDGSIFRRARSHDNDSDSDSELSMDEHSSSYASSRSSDSEEDDVMEDEKAWKPTSPKNNERGPVHSTPKVDSISNHVKPYWPGDCVTVSDSEDQGGKSKLKVETKVNVELHNENKINHCGDAPPDKENDGQNKDGKPATNQNNHLPELRKGILKKKVTYPPPLTDKNMKNRLREKLSDFNQGTISPKPSSLSSNDGVYPVTDPGINNKNVRRDPSREQINGIAMQVRPVNGETSDSDGSNETSI